MAENPDEARERAGSLREQATRCRWLASRTTDREIAHKLVELAQEFEQRAFELEAGKPIGVAHQAIGAARG